MRFTFKKITQVAVWLLNWREVILKARRPGRRLLSKIVRKWRKSQDFSFFLFCSCTVSSILHIETNRDSAKTRQIVLVLCSNSSTASLSLRVKAKVLSVVCNAPTWVFLPIPYQLDLTSCCSPRGHSAPATLGSWLFPTYQALCNFGTWCSLDLDC